MIDPATLARLASLLRVDTADLRMQPLPGGLSNRGCLLSCGMKRWAVRLPLASDSKAPSPAVETLSPESETRVLKVVAEAGLTPEVVVRDESTGALVTRFLAAAASLNAEQLRQPANIDRIAALMSRLHRLPVPAGINDFRPSDVAQTYIDAARGLPDAGRNFADERRRWGPEFKNLAQSYEAAFKPAGLCHNDLVAANILDDGRLWLVDFEFAVRADPILDLAGLAGLNGFGPTHCHRLLDAYYGPERVPITLAQLDQVIRLVRLMAFFWALAHGGGDPADDLRRFAAAMAAVLR